MQQRRQYSRASCCLLHSGVLSPWSCASGCFQVLLPLICSIMLPIATVAAIADLKTMALVLQQVEVSSQGCRFVMSWHCALPKALWLPQSGCCKFAQSMIATHICIYRHINKSINEHTHTHAHDMCIYIYMLTPPVRHAKMHILAIYPEQLSGNDCENRKIQKSKNPKVQKSKDPKN